MELSLPLPRRAARRGRRKSVVATRLGRPLDWLRHNRLALRLLLCTLVALPLLGGGWLWLRNSPLVAVRHVHITGVHGADAIEIRNALDGAATHMTTMNFSVAALRSSVSTYAMVGGIRVKTSFPHSVSISVTERPPVAALLSAGQSTSVAADGTVLGPALLSSSLPSVHGSVEPAAGERLREPKALAAVTVLGAVPVALARYVVRAYEGPEGLTVAMRSGLLVYFGDSSRPHAKWLSFARVLASPSAAGALYVDVRLPERPAAGFSLTSSSSSSSSSFQTSTAAKLSESGTASSTVAALAANLEKAAGGGAGASTGSPTSGSGESEASTGSSPGSESAPGG